MLDDAQLLREYAENRSQQAFAELVHRHVGLVYHAALRLCGDGHRAEDVAQAVFADLARKAGQLASRPVITGWLHTSTRYAALQVLRSERRRQAREREAESLREINGGAGAAESWLRLRQVIDDVLADMDGRDCEAVLLRYFEELPFSEIGARLAVSEDAARMRVDRALGRMREALGRRGVTSTTAALAEVLAVPAGASVPAGLAAQLAGGAAAASSATVLSTMSMSKVYLVAVLAIGGVGATGLLLQHRSLVRLKAEADEVRSLAEDNARLRRQISALAPVPTAPTAAPGRAPEPAPGASAGGRPAVPLARGLLSVADLGNSGRSTPRAAFATQLWAARTGDVALEASTLAFGPEARARLEALEAVLPADLRAEYDTPEKLMAFMLAGSPHPVGGMQVLSETPLGNGDVSLETEWQHVDDSVVHHNDVTLQSSPDGWKLLVPLSLVDRASAYLERSLTSGSGSVPVKN